MDDNNPTTRKFPRTMNEAFGPYEQLDEQFELPYTPLELWIAIASFAIAPFCAFALARMIWK